MRHLRFTGGQDRLDFLLRSIAPIICVVAVLGVASAQLSCVIAQRKLTIPKTDEPIVMVLSNRLGGPIRKIARHAYIAVREAPDDKWTIWECCSPGSHTRSSPFQPSFGDEVRLHAVITGTRARKAAKCLGPATEKYGDPKYWMWPGPNSNTYVEAMTRECDIPATLPSTAVGKDHRGLIGASVTSEGTGVQIETPIIGVKIGLKEGIELHLFGLAIGVDLWPPAIIVPLGEGRLGFGDR